MKFQKGLCLFLIVALILAVSCGCAQETADTTGSDSDVSSMSTERPQPTTKAKHSDKKIGFQLEQPKAGEKAAVLHTNFGDIYIRLFPDEAPKTVENFTGLIEKGYYNGLTFHRIAANFCVQGGDPMGTGQGGESLWGGTFEDEFCYELLNLRYSVAMANSGEDTNGSQFFFNTAPPEVFDRSQYDYDTQYANFAYYYQQYAANYGESFTSQFPTVETFITNYCKGINSLSYAVPEEVWKLYEQYGGNVSLDGAYRESAGHTVFGQVYKGMDVVDKMNAVEVDENSKPLNDVIIKSAEVITVS